MHEFKMPSLGADMEAGTLVEWLVKPGDTVKRGQVVAVVETQKGAIEVEIWEAGVVERLLIEPQTRVPVGMPLALVREAAEPAAAPPPAAAPAPVTAEAAVPESREATRARISPAARKRAQELGLDLRAVQPTRAEAGVTLEDVERAAVECAGAAERGERPSRPGDWQAEMRKAIAAAMSRSKREIPHYYLSTEIDVTDALAWLAGENAKRPVEKRMLPAAIFMKAVALALQRAPGLNGVWRDGAFSPSTAVHLGMAIAMRGGGLVAPAIHDADAKSVDELMAALRDLIERVRSGRLRGSELTDPTVTLTSLGDQGVDRVYPVIYPPQVAIVGLGRITARPWAVDGKVLVRNVVTATLAADHRVSDGHLGARYLTQLERLLQAPENFERTS
ncbi:MAG: dihydrolipoamide acetyltransferase family protein [Burkholderiales bacterium]